MKRLNEMIRDRWRTAALVATGVTLLGGGVALADFINPGLGPAPVVNPPAAQSNPAPAAVAPAGTVPVAQSGDDRDSDHGDGHGHGRRHKHGHDKDHHADRDDQGDQDDGGDD